MLGVRKLQNAIHAFNSIREASTRFGPGYPSLVKRFLHLYCKRRFSIHEMRFNDLLNPRIPDAALDYYMSKEDMLALDEAQVLRTYLCVTADKSIFYSLCMTAGIPTPRLLAVFDLPAGWIPDGRLLQSRAEWCAFLQTLPQEFVVKPALGLLGKGVNAFRRDARGFVDYAGSRRSDDELYDFLCSEREMNLFTIGYAHHSLNLPQGSHKTIIQEKLTAHPKVAELTGSQTLCTCRLFTRADQAGNIQVLGSAFRLVGGNALVDNFDQGAGGNLWCSVDADSGRIRDAFAKSAESDRLEYASRHPVTGRDVVGFRIPDWSQVVELARHLATTFRPQTLVTWDIGVSNRGPVALEGNVGGNLLPSPLNQPVRTVLADR